MADYRAVLQPAQTEILLLKTARKNKVLQP